MNPRVPAIGLLTAALLTAGFWFGLYRPAAREQTALQAQTADLRAAEQSLRNEVRQLREVLSRRDEITQALERLDDLVPPKVAQAAAVRDFQGAADDAGVELASLTFSAPAAVVGAPEATDDSRVLAQVPVSMTVDGGYFQVVDFFRRLETVVPRAVQIQGVSLAEAQAKFPTLSTTVTGRLFARAKLPADPAAVPVPQATPETAPPATATETS